MSPYNASDVRKGHKLDRTSGQYFDDKANWISNNPVLQPGQIALESDSTRFKIGNGNARWSELPYYSDGPVVVEEYLQGVSTKGFALDELLENKHIEVRFSDAKESEAADEDFYIQPLEQGKAYAPGDIVSLKQDGEGDYVQWRSFETDYNVENDEDIHSYSVYAIPSVIIQADRVLDWAQGVEDGYIDINSNYVLKYAGKVGEFEPNTPYRFLDKITVPYGFNHEYIGDTAEETLTLAWCNQDYQGSADFDSDYFEILDGDPTYLAEVVPWNEEENKATLHVYDPATIMDRTQEEVGHMVSETRFFYVMKQVNGHNTLWYSRWHRQATAPSGTDELQEMPADYLLFDGNLCWSKNSNDFRYANQRAAYPPFDAGIEDGATMYLSTAYGTAQFCNLNILSLGGANHGSQQVYSTGVGAGSVSEGIKLTWHRAQGVWTTENT